MVVGDTVKSCGDFEETGHVSFDGLGMELSRSPSAKGCEEMPALVHAKTLTEVHDAESFMPGCFST